MGSSDGSRRGAQFDNVEMTGARFRVVDRSGARFDQVDLSGVVMRGVELLNVDIDGAIENLTINGVDIGPMRRREWMTHGARVHG